MMQSRSISVLIIQLLKICWEKKKDVSSVFSEFIVICWQLDNEEPADDDSDFDEYDSVFLPV